SGNRVATASEAGPRLRFPRPGPDRSGTPRRPEVAGIGDEAPARHSPDSILRGLQHRLELLDAVPRQVDDLVQFDLLEGTAPDDLRKDIILGRLLARGLQDLPARHLRPIKQDLLLVDPDQIPFGARV